LIQDNRDIEMSKCLSQNMVLFERFISTTEKIPFYELSHLIISKRGQTQDNISFTKAAISSCTHILHTLGSLIL